MTKLLIGLLLVLISVKAMSFEAANTGTYSSANLQEVDIQDCMDELDLQYTGVDGKIDYSDDLTVNEMIEMENECIKENK